MTDRIVIHTEFIKPGRAAENTRACVKRAAKPRPWYRRDSSVVNGEACTMRGKKIRPGDRVSFGGSEIEVAGA